ncbi:tyrosine-protein phosphatase [Glutamicibacter arilaitensis]|uniref:tyrosine-protein phosphatase n=1 Tax=Glutamicibacter arilaitensis TaxID=256701 RepID=UPI00384D1B2D
MSATHAKTAELMSLRPVPGIGPNRIYRAGALSNFGPRAIEQFQGLDVGTLIDLREPQEIQPQSIPVLAGLRYRAISLYSGLLPVDRTLGEVQRILLDGRGARLVAALRAIANATGGSIVVQCRNGGERTGLVLALLAEALGLDRAQILADFAPESFQSSDTQWQRDRATMDSTLDWLTESYGSVAGYLLSKGFTGAELLRLQSLANHSAPRELRSLVAS